MATSLKARKGVLTRQSNALTELLQKYKSLKEDEEAMPFTSERIGKYHSAQVHLRAVQTSLEKAFYAFAEEVDKHESDLTEEEQKLASKRIEEAQELIAESEDLLAHFEMKKQDQTCLDFHTTVSAATPKIELPKIPIPEFSGKCWQWDNFWQLFDATVNSLPISDLQKFNYLLKALKGEARESARRYQVTAANYPLVVKHLKEKFGNAFSIVRSLYEKLEECRAQSNDLKDQYKLFDRLSSLTQQLQEKGENLNKVKVTLPDEQAWSFERQIKTLDTVLKQELEIRRHLPQRTDRLPGKPASDTQSNWKRSPFCFYCDSQEHWSTACTKLTLPKDRIEHLKRTHRCLGCGSRNHVYAECKSKGCAHCGKKHHTSTCFKAAATTRTNSSNTSDKSKKFAQNVVTTSEMNSSCSEEEIETNPTILTVAGSIKPEKDSAVFLLTGTVQVIHPLTKKPHKVQVLLDTGADKSFVDSKLAAELQLPEQGKTTMKLTTFGSKNHKYIECTSTTLEIVDAEDTSHRLRLLVHDNVTMNLPRLNLDADDIKFIRCQHINLCSATKSNRVQPRILIGCDQLWNFVQFKSQLFKLPSGLLLIPTVFGYMISGQKFAHKTWAAEQILTAVNTVHADDQSDYWEQFWTSETIATAKEDTGAEKAEKAKINAEVLANFNNTIQRRTDGYYVQLPFKTTCEELPDNKALAWRRLSNILQKYKNHPEVLKQYDNVFKDQLEKGILEQVDEKKDSVELKKHYLAHQPVITPHKSTTKFRVVFDASAHYKGCASLNEVIHQGPTLLPKLFGILLRFRTGKYVLLSDVEKAFLQIRIREEDRDFTRCFWVKDITKPFAHDNVVVFRFTRVTFGINASPFLLSATILYHLENYVDNKKLAEEIATNLYVDNLFLSAFSEEEALEKYRMTKEIFTNIQMNLREFVSNNINVMKTIAENDRSSNTSPKVLGIPWNSSTDNFELRIIVKETKFVNKRIVAQQIASVYDPLGWYIPLLVKAKHFQQQLWKNHYEWDEPLNQQDIEEWTKIVQNLNGFECNIPRMVSEPDTATTLITFTDASSIAMAACTYIASETRLHLLMAKSKVVDANRLITIPKLELNSAAIGARLTLNVLRSLKSTVNISQVFILCDSEIALSWITTRKSKHDGVFIRNRVKEITNVVLEIERFDVKVNFGYVGTNTNLADCATRGLLKDEFARHPWWTGYNLPQVLKCTQKLCRIPPDEGEDISTEVQLCSTQNSEEENVTDILNLDAYSSLKKARRVLAYVLRFLKGVSSRVDEKLQQKLIDRLPWLKHSTERMELSATDIRDAQYVLITNHQRVKVKEDYRKDLSRVLNLKEDEAKVLRAYGRLNKSDLSTAARNPIFIAPHTALSRLLILEAHGRFHNGTAHTMSEARQMYWIPRLREQVKKIIRQCVQCQRVNNLAYKYPTMTDLPNSRVRKARPFQFIGLDYFGPLTVSRVEGGKSKVYGCIFTCAVTRMIHLEVIADGTTEKFLNAFRRFVARRGKPQSVTCDNAPTFLLGSQILNDSLEKHDEASQVERTMSNKQIDWHHITPYSPWKGGFYERLIKIVKESLFKSIGRRTLSADELTTLLTEVEACVNTRPLTYQETGLEDICSLRPIDFLQNEMDVSLAITNFEEDTSDPSYLPSSEAVRLQTRIQAQKALRSSTAITERYWRIWKTSYLTALREQHRCNLDKHRGCSRQPKTGDVVLIADACDKRYNWKLGRITHLLPSSDGAVREAEVLCGRGNYIRRPINQLVPLELDADSEDETTQASSQQNQSDKAQYSARSKSYNLRPRSHKTFHPIDENNEVPTKGTVFTAVRIPPACLLITTLCAAMVTVGTSSTTSIERLINPHIIGCRTEGVYVHSPNTHAYELCVNNYCFIRETPPIHEVIDIPPSELVHEYEVRWKIKTASNITTIETVCPAQPFCTSIKCTLCTANILNPECWPVAAIAGAGVMLYIIVALCYTICYVPVTVGRPFRLLFQGICGICYLILWAISKGITHGLQCSRRTRPRTTKILEALAICGFFTLAQTCQTVNVFSHHITNCIKSSDKTTCSMEVASILKINSFKKDACIRLQRSNVTVMEIELHWIGLRLLCEKNTIMYSRDVQQKIIDSKRCPHMGSCVGNKCADINASSLLPELSSANTYPGNTGCYESCGGPGCDCFYLSSGCLFYRIFAVPRNDDIYEFFTCSKWKEEVKMQVRIRKPFVEETTTIQVGLRPNVPQMHSSVQLSLSVLSWQYLPQLDVIFVSKSNVTAIWTSKSLPILRCASKYEAKHLLCSLYDSCQCHPAESQVTCTCQDQNIDDELHKLKDVLPVTFPFLRFTRHRLHNVMARIDQDITAEVIINVKENIDKTIVDTTDDVCVIPDTQIYGCYSCVKGAIAVVQCSSKTKVLSAEVRCGSDSFTISCSPRSEESILRFLFSKARVQLNCTVECGSRSTTFEITGILKYVHTLQGQIRKMAIPTHNTTTDFTWPDFAHILDVYLQWYKAVVFTILTVGLALLLSYSYLTTASWRLLRRIVKAIRYILLCTIRLCICTIHLFVKFVCSKKKK